jgi:hypothetical protein
LQRQALQRLGHNSQSHILSVLECVSVSHSVTLCHISIVLECVSVSHSVPMVLARDSRASAVRHSALCVTPVAETRKDCATVWRDCASSAFGGCATRKGLRAQRRKVCATTQTRERRSASFDTKRRHRGPPAKAVTRALRHAGIGSRGRRVTRASAFQV